MGPTLAAEVTGIDSYTRFMIIPHALMSVGDKKFYDITTYAAIAISSNYFIRSLWRNQQCPE